LAVGGQSTSILWRLNLAFYCVVPAITRKGATFWSQLKMELAQVAALTILGALK